MDDKLQVFKDVLYLSDGIKKISIKSELDNFEEINLLCANFMNIYKAEKEKLPYHINILDVLWANENAHSRVLEKLLKQKNENGYEILADFIQYIKEIDSNFDLIIENPKISSEKDRIDLLVLDNKFALIIENKIHGAIDQKAQLARYIKKVNDKGYEENNIYVIYLTRDGSKEPTDDSWELDKDNYKDRFQKRYLEISFRDTILPWLKNNILPNCRIKELYLKSTLEQYIDHLEGLFHKRKIHNKMNEVLKAFISETLDLSSSPADNIPKLEKKLSEVSKVENQLRTLIEQAKKDCWEEWSEKLKEDFPNYEMIDKSNAKDYPKIGIKISYRENDFSLLIETHNKAIYYGIRRHHSSAEFFENVKLLVLPLIGGFEDNQWWYGYKYTSYKNAYSRLSSLIKSVQEELKNKN